jgi:hypothetical protein
MDLLGGVGQMEARFDPFRYNVNLSARFVHGWAKHGIGPKFVLGASGGTPR